MRELTLAQARRTALAAQGLLRSPVSNGTPVTMRGLQQVVDRIGLLQIDSVNVLARAHLMPLYSRLGPYDPALLERAAGRRPRRLVESWAHEASYVPPTTWRLLGWRRRATRTDRWYSVAREHPELVREIHAMLATDGPLTAAQVQAAFEHVHPRGRSGWWKWSKAKHALEYLFAVGEVGSSGRTNAFERRYDVIERVVPAEVLAAPEPSDADAVRGLVEISARAHGVADLTGLRDYFRIARERVLPAVDELVEAGVLEPVRVRGWTDRAWLHRDAPLPRVARAATLLSPFDPVVFERSRLQALFGMRYRIEIYTPAHKRVHGYYVLPFLVGDTMAARVDLKADRPAGVLRVPAAHLEPGAPAETPALLSAELERLAGWLGLSAIEPPRWVG